MNKVELIGRLTKDPDIRYTQGGEKSTAIARFTLAVDRRFKRDGDDATADFITCVAFGNHGTWFEKYGRKGLKIAVTGRIQTGSYVNREGQKIYTTEVVVDEQEFVESKQGGVSAAGAPANAASDNAPVDNYVPDMDDYDEELPFN